LSKNITLKKLYISSYTLTRQEYPTKVIYVKNNRKIHEGSETESGSGSETNRKVGSGSGSEK
jgi:hypothetical protein